MTKEEMIKQTSEGFELPVEQVALIWSVAEYFVDCYHGPSLSQKALWEDVERFIREKF